MRPTYLQQLWQHDRFLGLVLLLFISGQVFFIYKGVETFPFVHFGMYAQPAKADGPYTQTTIRLGGGQGTYLPLKQVGQPIFWEYQLRYYAQLRQQFPSNAPLRTTIHKRFQSFPFLEQWAYKQLCNDVDHLYRLEEQINRELGHLTYSICEENFDWVNGNFVLINQTQLYEWTHPRM